MPEIKQVQGLLAREVPIAEDREDILHDAYVSLIRSHGEFRGDAKLQTFIYRVVQIAILQRLRSDRARRREKMVRLTFEMDGEDVERTIPVKDYPSRKWMRNSPRSGCTLSFRSRCGRLSGCG